MAASFGARAKLSAHQTSLFKRLKASGEETKAKRAELLPPQNTNSAGNTSAPIILDNTSISDWDIVEASEISEDVNTMTDAGTPTKAEAMAADVDRPSQVQEPVLTPSPSDLQNQFGIQDESTANGIHPSSSTAIPLFKAEGDGLIESLHRLKAVLPRRKAAYGSTLADLTRMSDLISKKSVPKLHSNSPLELEVRKEIAAAKGLLLNRLVPLL